MTDDYSRFRAQLVEDYQGALLRLATLRANSRHYLLFGWVELFPHDVRLPKGWNAGKAPWPVPGQADWTLGFSTRPLSVEEALDTYESASGGKLWVGLDNKRAPVEMAPLGAEPRYGGFCVDVKAPFTFQWHNGPRLHRLVAMKGMLRPVQLLGGTEPAREWLLKHLGFDPYHFNEWLGGLALVAPNPVCSSIDVFPSARHANGSETLTFLAVPRRSAKGVPDLSCITIQAAERRADGWAHLYTVKVGQTGYVTIPQPQITKEIGFAVVCERRGLLFFFEPHSWIEQVGFSMNIVNRRLDIEVPAGGRRKPARSVTVHQHVPGPTSLVGEAVSDAVSQRLMHLIQRRKARERRAAAPQKLLGIVDHRGSVSNDQLQQSKTDAEAFVADLINRAQRRVVIVDPFFGQREMRLFAMRTSAQGIVPRILTGRPALDLREGKAGDEFVADLEGLRLQRGVQVPVVRVMPGNDKPAIHDRYLIIDKDVWHCGPSFNELGDRLGLVVKLQDPISVRRVVSKVWCRSAVFPDCWRAIRAQRPPAS